VAPEVKERKREKERERERGNLQSGRLIFGKEGRKERGAKAKKKGFPREEVFCTQRTFVYRMYQV
jgi:hypothetical protein